jgi:hypothetical protein
MQSRNAQLKADFEQLSIAHAGRGGDGRPVAVSADLEKAVMTMLRQQLTVRHDPSSSPVLF